MTRKLLTYQKNLFLRRKVARYIEFAWKRVKSSQKRYFAMSRISRRVLATLLAIKNSGFSEECEWRLVCVFDQPPLFFRAGRFGITPFVKIPLCADTAKMTWIPNLEPDAAATALRQLLTFLGIKGRKADCKLRRSEIPYRY